jgi:aspartyl-tRNA(Asn)/glutamyl-tRNA(Gln) amidotransferase subunit C
MSLQHSEVEHVARLAHLGISAQEIDELGEELSSVLAHIEKLQEVDTTGVPLTSQAIQSENVWRDDVITPSLAVEAVLRNAPHRVGDLFEVQAILD